MYSVGIQAQLSQASNPFLKNGEKVIFDTILEKVGCGCSHSCDCCCDIHYRKNSGEFVIEKCGSFLVNWSVAIEGSDLTPYIRFALQVDNEKIYGASVIPISVGLVSGSSLVALKHPNTTISLINNTGDIVRLANVSPIANIVIMRV